MTTTRDVLVRARGYVERGWCQGNAALDAQGMHTAPCDGRAVRWCSIGAINAAAWSIDPDRYSALAIAAEGGLVRAAGCRSVVAWNDEPFRTQSAVLTAFDRAIAAQETP